MRSTDDMEAELRVLSDACLGYLIDNPNELSRFLDNAGFTPEGLRAAVGSRALHLGLLDYFVHNESALLAMCANANMPAERVMRLWRRINKQN